MNWMRRLPARHHGCRCQVAARRAARDARKRCALQRDRRRSARCAVVIDPDTDVEVDLRIGAVAALEHTSAAPRSAWTIRSKRAVSTAGYGDESVPIVWFRREGARLP